MAKFTPGPWQVWDGHAEVYSHVEENRPFSIQGHKIAECDPWYLEDLTDDDEEAEEMATANARLIAAAPELLEALQALVDIQNGPPIKTQADKWQHAMDLAQAALRKATHD